MPRIKYQDIKFSPDKLEAIKHADRICREFAAMGFDLTLRQLYYQFVAHDLFPADRRWTWNGQKYIRDPEGTPNAEPNYTWLGDIVSDARMAGLLDWDHIVDRTRNIRGNEHWLKPSAMLKEMIARYAIDKWADQPQYVEVWMEKDAMLGVVGQIAAQLDVPFFSCRGYTSQSEMWSASQRLLRRINQGKKVHIIHMGDHDPSGIDMSRDIKERLSLFCGEEVHVLRAALNMVQIRKHNPPPNPAKSTDSRFQEYQDKFGNYSWELDALDPRALRDIVQRAVALFRDEALYQAKKAEETKGRRTLQLIYDYFADVVQFLRDRSANGNVT